MKNIQIIVFYITVVLIVPITVALLFWLVPILSTFSAVKGFSILAVTFAIGVGFLLIGMKKENDGKPIIPVFLILIGFLTVISSVGISLFAGFENAFENHGEERENELLAEVNTKLNYLFNLEQDTFKDSELQIFKRDSFFSYERGIVLKIKDEEDLKDYHDQYQKLNTFCNANWLPCFIQFMDTNEIYRINSFEFLTTEKKSLIQKHDIRTKLVLRTNQMLITYSKIKTFDLKREETPLLVKELKEAGFELLYENKVLQKTNENVIHVVMNKNNQDNFFNSEQNILLLNILKNYVIEYPIRLQLMESKEKVLMNFSHSELKNEISKLEELSTKE